MRVERGEPFDTHSIDSGQGLRESGESRVDRFRISNCELRIFADGGLGIGDREAISDFELRISDLRELRFKSETRACGEPVEPSSEPAEPSSVISSRRGGR